jgi:hypothetical protein
MAKRQGEHGRRHVRSDESFRRRQGGRALRPIVLIVCEGAETEYRYFRAWKSQAELATVTIDVRGGKGQDMSVVETAMKFRDERKKRFAQAKKQGQSADPPFEMVWCVFDREGVYQSDNFWRAVERADAEQIRLAISNPCFEYWFLLHFRDRGAFFHNGQELLQELRQHIPDYAKNTDIFDRLYPWTDIALERAERHYTHHPEREHDRYPNPTTTVYQLLESLHTTK